MTNLRALLNKNWPPIPNWLAIIFLIGGFLGFIDSSYLSVLHYKNVIPPCSVLGECESVLTSRYAVIGGVPVSVFGALYYLALIVLSILYFDTRKPEFIIVAMGLSVLGFVFTLWLFYLQTFVIRAFCGYCLFSAVITSVLFIAALFFILRHKNSF